MHVAQDCAALCVHRIRSLWHFYEGMSVPMNVDMLLQVPSLAQLETWQLSHMSMSLWLSSQVHVPRNLGVCCDQSSMQGVRFWSGVSGEVAKR